MKAGGAYVPLDPSYRRERLHEMLGDAAPVVVLADAVGRRTLELDTRREITVGAVDEAAGWSDEEGNLEVAGLAPSNLAYVIYTSGSTGAAKGAQNEHRAVVNRLEWMQRTYELDATHVVLQKTPYGFDVSVWELFGPLSCGATMRLAEPEGHRDAGYLAELIRRHQVTTVHFVPSMLNAFLEMSGVEECTSLRRVICSGEALPLASVAACRRALSCARLDNQYGPTETAIEVTSWRCPEDFDGTGPAPIGRAVANTRQYVLDGHGELVPVRVVELHIGRVGVVRGYLNRPALTAERFVPDPFSGTPGAGMYRTGDLARYLPDGKIEFLGRNDHHVKIRGYRIELGEIEARLAARPQVREAVVIARAHRGGDKRLVAYVTTHATSGDDVVSTLREHLMRQLPEYMVPTAFVWLAALPLTPNGKLDRKALPAPDDAAVVQRTYEAPRGEVEVMIARQWCELLALERVGRQGHFFELGGHSLLAMRLMERLRGLGPRVDVRTLFENPTLREFATWIDGKGEQRNDHAILVHFAGDEPPIFFFPTGLADFSHVFALAKELDGRVPVNAITWDHADRIDGAVEAIADRLTLSILAIQSTGPYRLGGYSNGGVLAYAVAHHMLRLCHAVSFVGLVDVRWKVVPHPNVPITYMSYWGEAQDLPDEIKGVALAQLQSLSDSAAPLQVAQAVEPLGALGSGMRARTWADNYAQVMKFGHATYAYLPPTPLTLHLFWSRDTPPEKRTGAEWECILSGSQLRHLTVPGDHVSMMTDPRWRAVLGASISKALLGEQHK